MPKIVEPGFVVGLTNASFGILSNIEVFVALGDLQSSLLPVIQKNEAGKLLLHTIKFKKYNNNNNGKNNKKFMYIT